jgi:hypothetical protein
MREIIRGKKGMGWREEREKGDFALVGTLLKDYTCDLIIIVCPFFLMIIKFILIDKISLQFFSCNDPKYCNKAFTIVDV